MPTYTYKCSKCKTQFDILRPIADRDKVETLECPKCHKIKVKRILAGSVGLKFVGKGWYVTDYGHHNDATTSNEPVVPIDKAPPPPID